MYDLADGMTSSELLPVGIAVVAPDGSVRDENAASRRLAGLAGLRTADRFGRLNYFRACSPEQARSLHDVSDGRQPIFSWVRLCEGGGGLVLVVALPYDREPPSDIVLLHLDVSGLLPSETALALATAAQPGNELDRIVSAIEQTILKSMAPPGPDRSRPAPPSGGGADDGPGLSNLASLSPRQREVLALIGQGRSNTEIAALLGISMNTTKLHVAAVLRRLRLDNRMQAVALGARLPDRRS
ncbi:Putative HTH-type transcriptional regulator YhjB [Rhodoplanes serenus]|uniref:HTH-type transcriptional regulator YhjB n=1 Tax=Rhodoplanes serenus TaxID=200615 RepID=A0A3S4BF33_9BRAD|nr:helix-turn-helix transcriptional regulator [Rhodoplanes serenus]VCU08354.1 Putative HTH-type transcriptional regulator YhjB [Rhodoplanes serenus]